MYVLRRIRYPIKTWARPRRIPTQGERPLRLRGADRRMSEALSQLRQGVPLNWSQIEDDPELETLAYLQEVAQECKGATYEVPQELRSTLIRDLSPRLPDWKPEPVKVAPKSLAGFSENVTVLTQVEEDVPALISNVPQWIAATAACSVLVMLALWAASSYISKPSLPAYKWIEVREEGKPVTQQQGSSAYSPPSCQGYSLLDPSARRTFVQLPANRQQVQESLPFQTEFLPATFSVAAGGRGPVSYSTRLNNAAVAPCLGTEPDPSDLGATLKLSYLTWHQTDGGDTRMASLTVFQAKGQRVVLNAQPGSWKEVQGREARGVYWRGTPYRDMEGRPWIGTVSVLVVEHDDIVTTFIGEAAQGVSQEMLTGLVEEMHSARYARQTEIARPAPNFTWIGMRRGSEVMSTAQVPESWRQRECPTPSPVVSRRRSSSGWARVVPFESREAAQEAVGFPIVALPPMLTSTVPITMPVRPPGMELTPTIAVSEPTTATMHVTQTLSLADIWVLPCGGGEIQKGDRGSKVKMRYSAQRIQARPQARRVQTLIDSDVIVFQSKQQPVELDVMVGAWQEISAGDVRGVYWAGGPYQDPEGITWPEGAGVMLLEKDDTVLTIITRDVSIEHLTRIAAGIGWQGQSIGAPTP